MYFAKIMLTLAAIQYGIIPVFVDLSGSHVFHEAWPPHARFHMVWLLGVSTSVSLYVGYLVWGPSNDRLIALRHASILGCILLANFFVANFASSAYGGALSDTEHQISLMGIDGNLISFSVAALLQSVATFWIWTRESQRQSKSF